MSEQMDNTEQNQMTESAPKKSHKGAVAAGVVIAVLAAGYVGGGVYFGSHFLPGTTINKRSVAGETAEQVQKTLASAAKDYTLTLSFREGKQEKLSGEDFSYAYEDDGSAAKLLQQQSAWTWPLALTKKSAYTVEQAVTFDESALQSAVAALPELQAANMTAPKDAYVTYKDGQFVVEKETEGTWLSADAVQAAVRGAVQEGQSERSLADTDGIYTAAAKLSTDQGLLDQEKQLDKLVAAKITYDLPKGEKLTLDAERLSGWLKQEDGSYSYNEESWKKHITAFVDELSSKVNTAFGSWSFHSTTRGDITVTGGDYGYNIEKSREIKKLTQELAEGKTEEREPEYFTKQKTDEGNGIGGTYIEADLGAQHVYCYVDGKQVWDSSCVSGNVSEGHSTPTGIYQILYKDTNVSLTGQGYSSPVSWWMPFYNSCGFHDADWRSSFGGSIYQTNGSHGCINLPPAKAQSLYSFVQDGMPVVVYN